MPYVLGIQTSKNSIVSSIFSRRRITKPPPPTIYIWLYVGATAKEELQSYVHALLLQQEILLLLQNNNNHQDRNGSSSNSSSSAMNAILQQLCARYVGFDCGILSVNEPIPLYSLTHYLFLSHLGVSVVCVCSTYNTIASFFHGGGTENLWSVLEKKGWDVSGQRTYLGFSTTRISVSPSKDE